MSRTGDSTLHQWRNRPVFREVDGHRVRRLWRVVLAIAVAAAPTAIYLLQQNESLKVVYEINEMRAERSRLQEEERSLQMERARLESLASIELWATREYGLTQPGPECLVVVGRIDAVPDQLVALAPNDAE